MSQAAESPEAEFAASVVGEISQLDGAINRAEWRKRHPNDESLQDHKSYTCPSFKGTEVLRSGRELTRTAYFAPPISAPEDLALPESIGDALIDSSCTLAMIRVETIEDGLEVGRTLVQAVQKEVSKKYDNRKTLPRHQN
jgi:hypothetical protein